MLEPHLLTDAELLEAMAYLNDLIEIQKAGFNPPASEVWKAMPPHIRRTLRIVEKIHRKESRNG